LSANARPTPSRSLYLVAVITLLLLLCLALTVCLAASPRPPRLSLPRIEPTDAAASSGEDKIWAVDRAPYGPFRVELTQEEATSLLALRLPDSPFLKPQVHITGGRIYVSCEVSLGVPLHVRTEWTAVLVGGRPRLVLQRAAIGPFALPGIMLNSVTSTINEMIDESGTGIVPTAVHIEEGFVVVEGIKGPPGVP